MTTRRRHTPITNQVAERFEKAAMVQAEKDFGEMVSEAKTFASEGHKKVERIPNIAGNDKEYTLCLKFGDFRGLIASHVRKLPY
ncbi:hypothetical protein PN36_34095 [Candidatus Thiomargarita nelsonii]|uniref:Uncharacterized protein n=1 Tax=Candidatus Thiomargarita nelsonii TaxID=1003181 RepID=A0A4E0RCL5_9GAMM|nr:hypothetical protein PN36_34095 [Candidatus Thiomargarita nelsonii]